MYGRFVHLRAPGLDVQQVYGLLVRTYSRCTVYGGVQRRWSTGCTDGVRRVKPVGTGVRTVYGRVRPVYGSVQQVYGRFSPY